MTIKSRLLVTHITKVNNHWSNWETKDKIRYYKMILLSRSRQGESVPIARASLEHVECVAEGLVSGADSHVEVWTA